MKHLKLFLKTLISNNACVEAARTKEIKYNIFAVVFALLSLFLSVLPSTVNSFRKNGSDWISTYTYGLDTGLYRFTNDEKVKSEENFKFTLTYDKKTNKSYLENITGKWANTFEEEKSEKEAEIKSDLEGVHRYRVQISQEGQVETYFEVYYYDDTTAKTDENFAKFTTYLISGFNPVKRLQAELEKKSITDSDYYMYYKTDKDGKKTLESRKTSFMVFGRNLVIGYLYKNNSTSAVASFGGDYNKLTYDNLLKDLRGDSPKETIDKWKVFFDKSYEITRWNSSWTTTGIMCGVNGGIILFMGLMVFILTRGKNNPFRIYSFWDGQKIAYYASFTPAVLGMTFSFLLTNMAMMFFVLIFGVRVMWLSMRTLKPAQ